MSLLQRPVGLRSGASRMHLARGQHNTKCVPPWCCFRRRHLPDEMAAPGMPGALPRPKPRARPRPAAYRIRCRLGARPSHRRHARSGTAHATPRRARGSCATAAGPAPIPPPPPPHPPTHPPTHPPPPPERGLRRARRAVGRGGLANATATRHGATALYASSTPTGLQRSSAAPAAPLPHPPQCTASPMPSARHSDSKKNATPRPGGVGEWVGGWVGEGGAAEEQREEPTAPPPSPEPSCAATQAAQPQQLAPARRFACARPFRPRCGSAHPRGSGGSGPETEDAPVPASSMLTARQHCGFGSQDALRPFAMAATQAALSPQDQACPKCGRVPQSGLQAHFRARASPEQRGGSRRGGPPCTNGPPKAIARVAEGASRSRRGEC